MNSKYTYNNLKPLLREHGKTFAEFLEKAGAPPSRRSWNNGTHPQKGVGEVTASRMRIAMERVFSEWEIILPKEVVTPSKIT